MSTGRQTVKDLIEEAKKRIVLLLICIFGLSYIMSLTSSSVWVNLPAAASLIVFLRYISFDMEMRKRGAAYNRPPSVENPPEKKSFEIPKIAPENSNWRRKVNSPTVEAAIDQFTRHLVSEWVTDLWYSRLTPDKDGPEELVQIMNGVLGEVSFRARDINLIDLLTRDIINLICNHLELYRVCQAKIGKHETGKMPIGHQDTQLKLVLASENKLHPALFSAEAEHKVLQHLMGGLISLTFKPEDLQCSFFRHTVRELLACAVMRPVLNLANPSKKTDKGVTSSQQEGSQNNPSSRTSSDRFSGVLDRSNKGVELVQFKHTHSVTASGEAAKGIANGTVLLKNQKHSVCDLSSSSYQASAVPMIHKLHPTTSNLIPGDAQSSQSKNSSPLGSQCRPSGEWGQMLDVMSRRKTQALAPEHFENMWTKGRNYKKKEGVNQSAKQVIQNSSAGNTMDHLRVTSKHKIQDGTVKAYTSTRNTVYPQHKDSHMVENSYAHIDGNRSTQPIVTSYQGNAEHDPMHLEEDELESESSYPTEDDETSTVTGLDSPVTKVWDSKNNRHAAVSHIRHPLESSDGRSTRKSSKGHIRYQRLSKTHSGRKRFRSSNQKVPIWQEVERTTLSLGDGKDILNASKHDAEADDHDDSDSESPGRVHSGAAASSSAPSISISKACNSSLKSPENSFLEDSFLKLRCEVLGANFVKSGSKTFAVYSISVTDADNNNWSIKRRFRHFEELHRHLKEFSEYNLSLPPKHFLSSGLELSVVQERCKLLDTYLKKLLQLPTISGSIEVWDFLSVDSQTYMFSNSLSIIETLSVDLADKPYEKQTKVQSSMEDINDQLSIKRKEHLGTKSQESTFMPDISELKTRNVKNFSGKSSGKQCKNQFDDHSGSDSDGRLQKNNSSFIKPGKAPKSSERSSDDSPQETSQSLLEAAADPTLPTEWVPPNLSVPILDLVDVIFQLQDGGWIRRQAFWVAKQVLQLGMGDAFDDWLIEKILLLRRGSVIASIIKRIEQILWPDGIFLTKHPRRQRPPPSASQLQNSRSGNPSMMVSTPKEEIQKNNGKEQNLLVDEQQEFEAAQRAKFVYELMVDNAPATLVGLVGRKEYERCAKDIYFFLQSPLCLKQLMIDLLELLLVSAFPELDDVFKQCHEEKELFGVVEAK
ncbi:uncharacterized protein LOC131256706 isoform X3 [Magnolia sinica]|uniref:uncharacterized protein LOC131256706 isoform X3 n=1 Tax=Magnolia sinica TaxID=86752 RepID=UPI00265AC85E|nr:uncharacterized protein LOC131256706 isoform X3 [Magnolia sinica]